MKETKTAPYDVAEFLVAPEEMAAYLEACIQKSDGDAAFIAKALGDIAPAKGVFVSMSIMCSSSDILLHLPIFTKARYFLACWIQKMNMTKTRQTQRIQMNALRNFSASVNSKG
jgi:hypothetical protein